MRLRAVIGRLIKNPGETTLAGAAAEKNTSVAIWNPIDERHLCV